MTDQIAMFESRRHGETHLGFSTPAEHLHRADDQGGSIAAAARVVETGKADIEARVVRAALLRHPGATSAELAEWSPEFGTQLGQSLAEWRHTCARRLPGLEDRGLVRAIANRPSIRRPHRAVDPNLAPCTVSPGAPQSLRWWPMETP